MTMVLENLKVVDLTRILVGPFCTMMLGDMGADVVNIEEPNHGDETRSWTPFWNVESIQFLSFNRNKRSLSINLREKEAVDIILGLAAKSDVMIESFCIGEMLDLPLVMLHKGMETISYQMPMDWQDSFNGVANDFIESII